MNQFIPKLKFTKENLYINQQKLDYVIKRETDKQMDGWFSLVYFKKDLLNKLDNKPILDPF